MNKYLKKNLIMFSVIIVMIGLVGCSQIGSKGGSPSGDLVLEELQAVSGTKLEATFSNGETKTITDFTPKPLEVGQESEVSFVYEGTSFSKKIKYVITISGSLTDTSQKIMSTVGTSSFTVDDIAKVVLFFGKEYKTADVTNGTFNITIEQASPGGIAFLDADDNYMGYLSLANGLDSIPTQAISDETGEIDLGEITFTSDGIGEPSQNPFEEMSTSKKSVLETAGSFFGALVRSQGYIEQMVKGDLKIDFGLMYFPFGNVVDENGVGSLRDGSQIATHRLGVGFDPNYDNFENLKVDYPSGTDLTLEVTQEKIDAGEASPEGVSFAGVGAEEKSHFLGPNIPPAGEYHIRSGSDFDFTITMPEIQNDAQDNLVFPVPTFNINNEGIVESIEWVYKNKNGYTVDDPAEIIDNLEIQLGAKVQDNDKLEGNYEWTEHGRIADIKLRDVSKTKYEFTDKTIYWEDIDGLNMAYDDIFGVHYVTSYGRANASYSLTTNTEGNGSINFNPQKNSYSLGEDVTFSANTIDTSLFGYWKFANRDDIKIEPSFTMNILNDTDVTAVFGEELFVDNFTNDKGWTSSSYGHEEVNYLADKEELQLKLTENKNGETIIGMTFPPLSDNFTVPETYFLKTDFKLASNNGLYALLFMGENGENYYQLFIDEKDTYYSLWFRGEPEEKIAKASINDILNSGSYNTIAVEKKENKFSFFLNGHFLTEQEFDTSVDYNISAEAISMDGSPMDLRIDNVELMDLSQ